MNFVTAPFIADLFLLAIVAIGRKEVFAGTIYSSGIKPYDIMLFFFSLAYIAISIDASGLIRYLAFKVLQRGGGEGHRLFFYLYAFFFGLGSFIGNDPIILSGTAFLAYMTRVSRNIVHPRAWIHSQFAIANIASAILVSSNPTNLVLAGAFNIRFVDYTANMIIPVVITAIALYPCLFWIIFNDENFVPSRIQIHELSEEAKSKRPVNPNIPNAIRQADGEDSDAVDAEKGELQLLEEIMNPFLDKTGAAFGAFIMAATLICIIALNATSQAGSERPVFYVTLPAAFVMICWDMAFGWKNRQETRRIARARQEEAEQIRQARYAEGLMQEQDEMSNGRDFLPEAGSNEEVAPAESSSPGPSFTSPDEKNTGGEKGDAITQDSIKPHLLPSGNVPFPNLNEQEPGANVYELTNLAREKEEGPTNHPPNSTNLWTLSSQVSHVHRWSQETFPTVTAVLSHLPYALIPFSFCMFILVQGLVTRGWVPVFAYGWDHWVTRTGTVGAVGGMGFLSVILCNVSWKRTSSRVTRPVQKVSPDQLTFVQQTVRGHQYRHHHPAVPRHPTLAGHTRPGR